MYKIKKDEHFKKQLRKVYDFISFDSKYYAKKFNKNLQQKVEALPHMPYKFRQSIYFDDEQIRDLIYKGYTIPYLIDEENKIIVLLGIIKYKKEL